MRGVYTTPLTVSGSGLGSSPHARGLLIDVLNNIVNIGIIPACAGFTRIPVPRLRVDRDHPRMRGVYLRSRVSSTPCTGSSPHARGLLIDYCNRFGDDGIIPACAGFTRKVRGDDKCGQDHPRMRGVYTHVNPFDSSVAGSSPHARGLHPRVEPDALGVGIIPACAGFTSVSVGSWCVVSDHPRMRGVYGGESLSDSPPLGSSPHARGLLPMVRHPNHLNRIIPACAGFT